MAKNPYFSLLFPIVILLCAAGAPLPKSNWKNSQLWSFKNSFFCSLQVSSNTFLDLWVCISHIILPINPIPTKSQFLIFAFLEVCPDNFEALINCFLQFHLIKVSPLCAPRNLWKTVEKSEKRIHSVFWFRDQVGSDF